MNLYYNTVKIYLGCWLQRQQTSKQYLDKGFPVDARGEKDTSNNSSIPEMFLTKYLNFNSKVLTTCWVTALKSSFPKAMRFRSFSVAALIVGKTSSGSIYNTARRQIQTARHFMNRQLQDKLEIMESLDTVIESHTF